MQAELIDIIENYKENLLELNPDLISYLILLSQIKKM